MYIFSLQLVKGLSKQKHWNDQLISKTSDSGLFTDQGRSKSKTLGGSQPEAFDLMITGTKTMYICSFYLKNLYYNKGKYYLLL